jgi:hypothetical protein
MDSSKVVRENEGQLASNLKRRKLRRERGERRERERVTERYT